MFQTFLELFRMNQTENQGARLVSVNMKYQRATRAVFSNSQLSAVESFVQWCCDRRPPESVILEFLNIRDYTLEDEYFEAKVMEVWKKIIFLLNWVILGTTCFFFQGCNLMIRSITQYKIHEWFHVIFTLPETNIFAPENSNESMIHFHLGQVSGLLQFAGQFTIIPTPENQGNLKGIPLLNHHLG